MKIKITNNALDNLEEILFYIEFIDYSPSGAKRIKTKIIKTIKKNIQANPFLFRECDEIETKGKIYRKALCSPYWIIYKIKSFEIIVLGIIHTSQSPAKIKGLRRVK